MKYLASSNYPHSDVWLPGTRNYLDLPFLLPTRELWVTLWVSVRQSCKNSFPAKLTKRFYDFQVLKLPQTQNDSLGRYFKNLSYLDDL